MGAGTRLASYGWAPGPSVFGFAGNVGLAATRGFAGGFFGTGGGALILVAANCVSADTGGGGLGLATTFGLAETLGLVGRFGLDIVAVHVTCIASQALLSCVALRLELNWR